MTKRMQMHPYQTTVAAEGEQNLRISLDQRPSLTDGDSKWTTKRRSIGWRGTLSFRFLLVLSENQPFGTVRTISISARLILDTGIRGETSV